MPQGKTFYINTSETAVFETKVRTKNPGNVSIPVNLAGKILHFYVKINEQDADGSAFIHKSTGSGIIHTDESTGTAEITITSADTTSLAGDNVTHKMYWSLRLVYGSVNKFISEGVFVVTPA